MAKEVPWDDLCQGFIDAHAELRTRLGHARSSVDEMISLVGRVLETLDRRITALEDEKKE